MFSTCLYFDWIDWKRDADWKGIFLCQSTWPGIGGGGVNINNQEVGHRDFYGISKIYYFQESTIIVNGLQILVHLLSAQYPIS
jgi:hypothetical protein